jgi:hypothetical protein
LLETRQQIRAIVAASEPDETVALLNLHFFEWRTSDP